MPKNKGKFVSFSVANHEVDGLIAFSSFQERVERTTKRERSPMREREPVVSLFSRRMAKVYMSHILLFGIGRLRSQLSQLYNRICPGFENAW